MRFLSILMLFFFINTNTSIAQNDSSSTRINKRYIISYLKDAGGIVVAPIHWKSSQWLETTAVVGITAAIATQDKAIHDFAQSNRTSTTNNISKFGLEPWGSGVYSMALLAIIYTDGVITKNPKNRAVAMLGVKTFLVSAAITTVVKQVAHRHRPFQETNAYNATGTPFSAYDFDGPFSNTSYTSFPSGHTMAAFAVATIIASAYKDYKIVPILAYSVATLTGLSRINDNDHWASDVLMGAALGYGMAKFIYNHNTWGINVLPYYSQGATGISLQMPVK
jgi:membrane-associated phospholipid phosphatase